MMGLLSGAKLLASLWSGSKEKGELQVSPHSLQRQDPSYSTQPASKKPCVPPWLTTQGGNL